MAMHYSSIDNPKTATARVLRVLRRKRGAWISSWELTTTAHVSAVGTRVSEIRAQGVDVEHRQRGAGHYYRLVRAA